MRDDVRMRELVKAEVELTLMERSLGWARIGVLLATLIPVLELFGDARPRVLLVVTISALVQWGVYFKRRRTYEEAVEEQEARFGGRDRLIGTMARRSA